MVMTSHCERLLEVSSRLWDRTRRNCVIRIVTVDRAGFSSHGVSTTVDTSDRMLLTPGCTCLWGTTVHCDKATCWLTYTYPLTRSFVPSFRHSFIHPSIHSFIHLLI